MRTQRHLKYQQIILLFSTQHRRPLVTAQPAHRENTCRAEYYKHTQWTHAENSFITNIVIMPFSSVHRGFNFRKTRGTKIYSLSNITVAQPFFSSTFTISSFYMTRNAAAIQVTRPADPYASTRSNIGVH